MALDVVERDAGWRNLDHRRLIASAAGSRRVTETQIGRRDDPALGQQHGPLDRVLELTDVAGPVVAHQQLLRVSVKSIDPFLQLGSESPDERAGERHDILLALA